MTKDLAKHLAVNIKESFLQARLLEILMLSDKDLNLYQENPIEYIRQDDDDVFHFDQVYAPK